MSDDLEVFENNDLTVTVSISANPQQTQSVWSKGSMTLSNSDRIRLSPNSIEFIEASRTDAGEYTITVTNSVGPGTLSFNLNVTCKY